MQQETPTARKPEDVHLHLPAKEVAALSQRSEPHTVNAADCIILR